MKEIFEAPLFAHLFILPWIFLVLFTLRPGGAEKSFELNKKYLGHFLPGKWKEREYFVLWTRRLAAGWLFFFVSLYVFLLLNGPPS